jgi:hypothetical protein
VTSGADRALHERGATDMAVQAGPNVGRSLLASWTDRGWEGPDRPRGWIGGVYGLVVHTTGGGVASTATTRGVDPAVVALDACRRSHGCHYLLGWNGIDSGELFQLADERAQANGVGMSSKRDRRKDQKRSIAEGRFEADLPAGLVERWRARWPGAANPLELLPGTTSANSCYVHLECIPCVWSEGSSDTAEPMRTGLRFTTAQHDAVGDLAVDVARRNRWLLHETWWRTSRLLGHEDLTPISQHDGGGGCDPGYLRARPYFDWDYVYDRIETLVGHVGTTDGCATGPVSDQAGSDNTGDHGPEGVRAALEHGVRDENELTNRLFFERHPELAGRAIRLEEQDLAAEWIKIRNDLVRPVLDEAAIDG